MESLFASVSFDVFSRRIIYCVLVFFTVQTATTFADGYAGSGVSYNRARRDIGSESSAKDYKHQYGYSSFYPNNQYGNYQASSSVIGGAPSLPKIASAAVPSHGSLSSYSYSSSNNNNNNNKQPVAASYYPNSPYAYQSYNAYNAYPYNYNYPSSYYNSAYAYPNSNNNNYYYPYNSQYSSAYNRYPYSPYSYYDNANANANADYYNNNGQYYNNYNYDQYYRSGFAPYSSYPYTGSAAYYSPTAYPTTATSTSSEKKE